MDRPPSPMGASGDPGADIPEWVKHAVFYQIFPDRFACSERVPKPRNLEPWDADPTPHGYKGGDLLGVVERLDYLQELGVTALYFNPIFQSASNHRYHTHDYFRVDPLLGGDAAFEAMLAECHRRGIRVVLDGVLNHASRGFFQFNDILENGAASPWVDWFHVHAHPANAYDRSRPPGYEAWFGLRALPKFNTDDAGAREFLMQVGEHWLRRDIDGWRLDVPNEVTTPGFWEEFRRRCRAINPEAYLVGEIWEEATEWLRGDRFDAVMNYRFTEAAIAFAAGHRVIRETVEGRGYAPWPGIDAPTYAGRIDRLLALYPWQSQLAQLNLLDSHDTSRLLSIAGGDRRSLELGALLLFTFPGAPCVYYGDEIGLVGALPDHFSRGAFPWDRPETWDRDLLATFTSLIALRRERPALRTGTYRRLYAKAGAYVFGREGDRDGVIVAVNASDGAHVVEVEMPELLDSDGSATVVFSLQPAPVVRQRGGHLRLELPPRSGAVARVDSSMA
ncbi:MAG: glycoside hydrolase family 13 protein [Chloroflexota bacterium]|nr:glycoside hydrolase family 13 protein [Chloroflexota bacterium]